MRISESMKYRTAVNSLGDVQNKYNGILEKMASQKRINRISDDPLGMTLLLSYRQAQASVDQYQRNIDNCTGWLNMTESKLTAVTNLLTNAAELAVGQGTATSTAETRRIAAENVRQIKDEMLSLANSMYGSRYLFSGSRKESVPFSSTYTSARIDAPIAAPANNFDGDVSSSGTYTGSSNNTYVVKIINGGAFASATYQFSTDGGKTWGAELDDLDTGSISLADGVSLTFNETGVEQLTAGDIFYVHAYAGGYYNGNDAELTVDTGRGTSVVYNLTGDAVFTGNKEGPDIFKALDDLDTALTNNDQQGILAQLDTLKEASNRVNRSISNVGNRLNRLELAANNLQDLGLQITNLKSKTEDADIAELVTSLNMTEIALKASYATVSKIGGNTILDFIK